MSFKELNTTELLIISTTLVVLLLGVTLVFLFIFIQKKKKFHYKEKQKFKETFSIELAKSQNEIRERAMENLSWEIHDNVGQLLSVSKLQLNRLETKIPKDIKPDLHEVTILVSKSLKDLRALSKSLNPIAIKKTGLVKALEIEVDRYNRLNFIQANIEINNEPFRLDKEKEIILFRIVQEFIHNSIRHAKASKLDILLNYNNDELEITVSDNGIGFDINQKSVNKGIGLLNMKGRAKLIKAKFNMTSIKGKGTTGYIKCNKDKIEL